VGTRLFWLGQFLIAAMDDADFRIERSGTSTKLSILKGRLKVARGKNSVVLAGPGERQFSDEDTIGTIRQHPVVREIAVGAAGGASGATVTGWMKRGDNPPSISHKSPIEP
jgi:hypothetical protein